MPKKKACYYLVTSFHIPQLNRIDKTAMTQL